jgi:hypothetical protein
LSLNKALINKFSSEITGIGTELEIIAHLMMD